MIRAQFTEQELSPPPERRINTRIFWHHNDFPAPFAAAAEEEEMEGAARHCCDIDVHKKGVMVHVLLKSSGQHGRPFWNILEVEVARLVLVHPAHMKALVGRKTDRIDSCSSQAARVFANRNFAMDGALALHRINDGSVIERKTVIANGMRIISRVHEVVELRHTLRSKGHQRPVDLRIMQLGGREQSADGDAAVGTSRCSL